MSPPSDSDKSGSPKGTNKGANKGTSSERAGLPFEPKGARKRSAKEADEASVVKGKKAEPKAKPKTRREKTVSKKGTKSEKVTETSAVSAKAQARVDEIRAMRQRRADKSAAEKSEKGKVSGRKVSGRSANSGAIPEAVSRRMLRRMAVLSGSPVLLGVGVFFLAYYLQSNEIVTFEPVVVLLVTMGCFGLGVLGLTYGVLSASWDDEPGSLVGLSEFKLNFSRVMDARRASKT